MTRPMSGVATRKMSVNFTLMVSAMMREPSTTNGERSKRRKTRLTPACAWSTSAVRRVMRPLEPRRSSSACESVLTCLNSAERTAAPNPTAALAAKNCAVIEQTRPSTPNSTMISAVRRTAAASPAGMAVLMTSATRSGTISSKHASSSLNSGPTMLSSL